jgi:hypothetical protein
MRPLLAALAFALSVLPATAGATSFWCPLEGVLIETSDGTIVVNHIQAEYNCCAWIEFEVQQYPHMIDIYEWERFQTEPCPCMCCFDLSVTVGGLAPGVYLVNIHKDGTFFGSWQVTVSGTSPARVETSYLPCVETGIPESRIVSSWGVIKALYTGR